MAYNLRTEDYLVYEWKDFRKALRSIVNPHMREVVHIAWKAFEIAYAKLGESKKEGTSPAYIVISADDPKAKEIIAILERED